MKFSIRRFILQRTGRFISSIGLGFAILSGLIHYKSWQAGSNAESFIVMMLFILLLLAVFFFFVGYRIEHNKQVFSSVALKVLGVFFILLGPFLTIMNDFVKNEFGLPSKSDLIFWSILSILGLAAYILGIKRASNKLIQKSVLQNKISAPNQHLNSTANRTASSSSSRSGRRRLK